MRHPLAHDVIVETPMPGRHTRWSSIPAFMTASVPVVMMVLFVLHIFSPAWAADPVASPGQGGMISGESRYPMAGRLPTAPFSPSQLPEPKSKGATLFTAYCAQCHVLPSPHSHTSDDWELTLSRMFAHMRMMEREKQSPWGRWMPDVKAPSDEEARAILAYLRRHGFRSAPEGVAPEAAGPGAALFRSTCARCHALPDPTQHTPAAWPAVVARMRGNMLRMGVPGIDEQTTKQIADFFVQAAGGAGAQP